MSGPGDIRTKIGYVKRLELYKTVKPYCLNVPVFPQGKMHNIEYEYVDGIVVSDIRGQLGSFNLDTHGFEIVNHGSALSYDDFGSEEDIYRRYFPECEALLKAHLGATRVFAFEHQIRRHQEGMEDNPVLAFNQPLTGAHCDQTPEAMDVRIRFHLPEEADGLLRRRRQVINIWRPLKGPVMDYPLAVCDARSIHEDDLARADLIFPHYQGENFVLHHNPAHRWFYLGNQQPSEVWLLKNQDSGSDAHISRQSAHAAVPLPAGTLGVDQPVELRESVEVRCLVFY